jgi:hypothetical protein
MKNIGKIVRIEKLGKFNFLQNLYSKKGLTLLNIESAPIVY